MVYARGSLRSHPTPHLHRHSILIADVFRIGEANSLPLYDVEPEGIRCGPEQFLPRGRVGWLDLHPIPIETLQMIQGGV